MKVFDLVCEDGHRFEGWFASADQFSQQCEAHAVHCPLCDSSQVSRKPSAPRLNLGGSPKTPAAASGDAGWLQALRRLMANTEDVGERFAEEARRIHYDEVPARAIRGVASDDEHRALKDEGIETVRLPLPRAATETLQ